MTAEEGEGGMGRFGFTVRLRGSDDEETSFFHG
jgi:hypothetical protein